MGEDADQDGVDLLEALMLAVEAVICVDSSGGEHGDYDPIQQDAIELSGAIDQMERALAAFRGEEVGNQ